MAHPWHGASLRRQGQTEAILHNDNGIVMPEAPRNRDSGARVWITSRCGRNGRPVSRL